MAAATAATVLVAPQPASAAGAWSNFPMLCSSSSSCRDEGRTVRFWQNMARVWFRWDLTTGCWFVDGDFGPNTTQATKSFQRAHNIDDDGWVGPATWSKADNYLHRDYNRDDLGQIAYEWRYADAFRIVYIQMYKAEGTGAWYYRDNCNSGRWTFIG